MHATHSDHIENILFLGDCNTLGTPEIKGEAYPEQLAKALNIEAVNCGHTMATTREGYEYFKDKFSPDIDLICIQYGLVDSWLTFKYSPYVLYYPDSRWRKLGRKFTKKFKKVCKKCGLNTLIGTRNVVPLEEYRQTILNIKAAAGNIPIVLIDTVPNKDTSRNAEIERYNQTLTDLAGEYISVFKLSIYDDFSSTQQDAYIDPTHISIAGHQFVAERLLTLIQSEISPPQVTTQA